MPLLEDYKDTDLAPITVKMPTDGDTFELVPGESGEYKLTYAIREKHILLAYASILL